MSAPGRKYESANGLLDGDGFFQRGRFAGTHISEVPPEYLHQLAEVNRSGVRVLQGELDRRAALEAASDSIADRIVEAGFRALAQSNHPDHGGDDEQMRELLEAREALRLLTRGGGR